MKPIFKQIVAGSIVFAAVINSSFGQARTLSLKEAFTIASKANRQLLISKIEELKAEAVVTEARSNLSPNVSASGNYSFYTERPVIFLRNESSAKVVQGTKVGGRNNFSAAVVATYPLINLVFKSKIRTAGISERLQRKRTEDIESEIALEIGQQYLNVLLYKEQFALLTQSLERNERALKDSRSLFLQGKSLKTDTLQNFISVQNLHASISALQNNIDIQILQLKQLLALEENENPELVDSLNQVIKYRMVQSKESSEDVALNNRNDLKIHLLQMDIGREQLVGVKAEFKPNLTAIGSYQLQAQSDQFSFWNYNIPRTSFVGVQLNVPIYSGNKKQSKLHQQQFNMQQDEIMLRDMKGRIKTELSTVTSKVEEAHNQNKIHEQNVQAAGISYKMIKDRYQYGMSNRLELADAELALTQAKIDALASVYNIRVLELQLEKALGLLRLN
jgi:outer membrane protein TolC